MAKRAKKATSRRGKRKVHLIASDETTPTVASKTGAKLEVVSVTVRGAKTAASRTIGARLCGGTSTCLALVEI